MPREIAIALVQMEPKLTAVEDNLQRMVELVEEIGAKEKVDLVLFPELITTGYECGVRFTELAETVPGHSVNLLANRAKEFNTYIAFGMVERKKVESVIYDAAVLIDQMARSSTNTTRYTCAARNGWPSAMATATRSCLWKVMSKIWSA